MLTDTTLMGVAEMAAHTWQVLLGRTPALDSTTAQPVGPADSDWGALLLDLCVCMLLVLLALEQCGAAVGQALGLREAKQKFAHAFAEMCYYTASLCCLSRMCRSAAWFWPAGWHEVMFDGRVQKVTGLAPYTAPADLKFFYLVETSYYVASFALLLARPRKKDFAQMAFHHVVTAALLVLSYCIGYMRIGAVVMFLHNIFDPFMLFAKCAHYVGVRVLPDVSFVCCAVAFAVPRLCLYPIAIHNAWLGACVGTVSCPGGVWDKTLVEFTLILLLLALLPIHVFWLGMILRVLRTALSGTGVQGDVRSDSEDEDGVHALADTSSDSGDEHASARVDAAGAAKAKRS